MHIYVNTQKFWKPCISLMFQSARLQQHKVAKLLHAPSGTLQAAAVIPVLSGQCSCFEQRQSQAASKVKQHPCMCQLQLPWALIISLERCACFPALALQSSLVDGSHDLHPWSGRQHEAAMQAEHCV